MNYINYKKIILILSCFLYTISYGYDIVLDQKYIISLNTLKVGTIIFDNKKCNIENNIDENSISKLLELNKKYNSTNQNQDFIISNLLQKNIMPKEWELLNLIFFINQKQQNNSINKFNIELFFSTSHNQKCIIFKWSDYLFNLYFCHAGMNFLLVSKHRNPAFISMHQLKLNDIEKYEEFIFINKITLLNISTNHCSNEEPQKEKNKSHENFNSPSILHRSSSVICSNNTDNYLVKKSNPNKNFFTLRRNKTMKPTQQLRNDLNILNIINSYCKTDAIDYFFLLSPDFINFLNLLANKPHKGNMVYWNNRILLINPFFPMFFMNVNQKPQITLMNIYLLLVSCETGNTEYGDKKTIFHFYDQENNTDDLKSQKTRYITDFLTIYTNEYGTIENIKIIEGDNYINFYTNLY